MSEGRFVTVDAWVIARCRLCGVKARVNTPVRVMWDITGLPWHPQGIPRLHRCGDDYGQIEYAGWTRNERMLPWVASDDVGDWIYEVAAQ